MARRGRPSPRRARGKSSGPRIFVSHSSADTWVAQQLAAHIQRAGATCFLDVFDIEVGEDFEERIREAIDECVELVVLLTPAALDSRYVWLEIGAAFGKRKRIVGILHGVTAKEVQESAGMPVLLKRGKLIQLNEVGQYFRELRRRVRGAKERHG